MDAEKYSRLTVVLDKRTDRALRHIAAITDTPVSAVVRDLLAEPAAAIADALVDVVAAKSPAERQTVLDQLDMFVEGAYGDYLQARGRING